jgi:hypothetical protein
VEHLIDIPFAKFPNLNVLVHICQAQKLAADLAESFVNIFWNSCASSFSKICDLRD